MKRAIDDTTLNSVPSVAPAPRAEAGPSAYLVVISGPSFGEMYKLKGERTVLGRGDCGDAGAGRGRHRRALTAPQPFVPRRVRHPGDRGPEIGIAAGRE